MAGWWESCVPGTRERVVLLQFDLKGHSPWAANQATELEPAKDRTEFALSLQFRLSYRGFDCLYWLGDGGVFAKVFQGKSEDADSAVLAADDAFIQFARFQKVAVGAHSLNLRATATLIQVVLHPQASHWFSRELNAFLKYERDIGQPGAFVITQELWGELSSQKRFPHGRDITVHGLGAKRVYTDSMHPFEETPLDRRFSAWLFDNSEELPAATVKLGNLPDRSQAVGQSIVVNTALSETGYNPVVVVPVEHSWRNFEQKVGREAADWQRRLSRLADASGTKAAVLRMTFPDTDDPTLQIECGNAPYSIVHAFHTLVSEDKRVHEAFCDQAFDFETGPGRNMPGTLTVSCPVLIRGEGVGYDLVLAHRTNKRGGWYGDRWSVGIHEQFAPVDSTWGERRRRADRGVVDAAIRGLREELLGDAAVSTMQVMLHAVFVEGEMLNVGILGVVILPDITFDMLRRMWKRAPDASEHSKLVRVPAREDSLRSALSAKSPSEIIGVNGAGATARELEHHWEPTAHLQFACCLWMVEKGLI